MLPRLRPTTTFCDALRQRQIGADEAGNHDVSRMYAEARHEAVFSRLEIVENSPLGWTILRSDAELMDMGL